MRRNIVVVAYGAAIVLFAACSAQSDKSESLAATGGMAAGTLAEPNIAELRSTIEAANLRSFNAMLAGDLLGTMANYTDNAIVMMPNAPMLNGRAAIESGFKSFFDMNKLTAGSFNTLDVHAGGDLAVETGTFVMTMTPTDGKPITDKGKYLTLWQRQPDGSWKIIRDINNSDGPPALAK